MSTPPPPPGRRTPLLVGVAIAAAVALVATGGVLALTRPWEASARSASPDPDPTPTHAAFPDLLAPASEIRVGEERWVSPCRVLPQSDAARIFGGFPDFSTTTEEYLDHGVIVHATSLPVESTCARGVPGEDPTVELSVTQYQRDENPSSVASDLAIEREDFQERLDRILRASPSTAAGKRLQKRMRTSVAAWEARQDVDTELDDLDGTVLPDGGIGATPEAGQSIHGLIGTTGFSLAWQGPEAEAAGVGERIDRLATAYDLIRKRIADPRLRQSPEPTVLGTTASVGRTRILEPCALLDAELFQSALGLPANDQNRREGAQWDLTARKRSAAGESLAPANACTRSYDADALPIDDDLDPVIDAPAEAALGEGYGSARLELRFYRTEDDARAAWERVVAPEPGFTLSPLATTADAAVVARSDAFDYSGYHFLVDGVIGTVSVSLVATEGGLEAELLDQGVPDAVFPALIDGIITRYREADTP